MVVEDTIKGKEIIAESLKVGEAAGSAITSMKATANSNQTIAYATNLAPAGVGSSAIAKWLEINIAGVVYFIPMWT